MIGCAGNQQANRDLYFRELRLQEDEIYRLEDCIKEYQGLIRGYRVEIDQLKSGGSGSPTPAGSRAPLEDRFEPTPSQGGVLDDSDAPRPLRQLLEPPQPRSTPAPLIDVPPIDLGEPFDRPVAPPSMDVPPQTAPLKTAPPAGVPPIDVPALPNEPPPVAPGDRYDPSEALPLPRDSQPLDILPLESEPLGVAPGRDDQASPDAWLEALPIGDALVDGYAGPTIESGEATLVTLITTTAASGAPTLFRGEVSLMLIDPDEDPEAQYPEGRKLARWDFTSGEVADSWRDDMPMPVLDLAVVLPREAPLDRKLELWVRLVDDQGEKVLRKTDLTLGRLASIETAKLAMAEPVTESPAPAPEQLSEQAPEQISEPVSEPVELVTTDWRASTRPVPVVAGVPAADSGWRRSDAPAPGPRQMIQVVTHEEPAPARIQPQRQPRKAKPSRAPGEWSPER